MTRPDGTEVEYFTILPTDRAPERLPLHLDIHGGPHAAWPSGRWLGMHQAIAAAGYAVVLPNPRGSTSYGQAFTSACVGDWGGADCEDILACCDDLVERGVADGGRMFLTGGSYGGFMTSWIVGHTDRFRAATAAAAVIDQTSMALTTEISEFSMFNMGGTPWAGRGVREALPAYVPAGGDDAGARDPLGGRPSGADRPRRGALHRPALLGKKAELVRYPGRLPHRPHPVAGGGLSQTDPGLESAARHAPEKAAAR